MKTRFLKYFTLILMLLIVSTAVNAQTMYLTITDNGSPVPASSDYYFIQIDVVRVNQFGIIVQHYTPYHPTQSISCNAYSNPWNVDVSCSDGPDIDVDVFIFRVDFTVIRDTNPPSPPPIASVTLK